MYKYKRPKTGYTWLQCTRPKCWNYFESTKAKPTKLNPFWTKLQRFMWENLWIFPILLGFVVSKKEDKFEK